MGGGVTLKGGMPESNVLIQGLSSMESRACQIACNQQPSPLSVGGMVHGEGKQRINTEWSFCSGDVVPFFFFFTFDQADETVFTWSPIPSPTNSPHCEMFIIPVSLSFFIHRKTIGSFLFRSFKGRI